MKIINTMLAVAAVLASSGLAGAQAGEAPQPSAPASCDAAGVQASYNQAVGAYAGQNGATKDLGKAKTLLDGIITTCGGANVTFLPRILRADIAMQDKDNETAFTVLSPNAATRGGIGGDPRQLHDAQAARRQE